MGLRLRLVSHTKNQSRPLWSRVPLFYARYFKLKYTEALPPAEERPPTTVAAGIAAVACGCSQGNWCGWSCRTVDSGTLQTLQESFIAFLICLAISIFSPGAFAPIPQSWQRVPREPALCRCRWACSTENLYSLLAKKLLCCSLLASVRLLWELSHEELIIHCSVIVS
jgi:hypothetical protein